MIDTLEAGRDISLFGKSGQCYSGKIYSDKNSTTTLSGPAIVCLTNSQFIENSWQHAINSIYNDDIENALNHFKIRDDVSHIIIIPQSGDEFRKLDKVDDLIRNYLHS